MLRVSGLGLGAEAAQFLDEFAKMSQTSQHSLLQHVFESIGLVCRFATESKPLSRLDVNLAFSRLILGLFAV